MTENRKFGLTVGTAFLVLAGISYWRGHPLAFRILAGLGGTLILGGLLVPSLLGPVQKAWMKMALLISKVTTPIFMGLVYYLSVVPIGLVMRMAGKNPIAVAERNGSFWHDRGDDRRSDLTRQF